MPRALLTLLLLCPLLLPAAPRAEEPRHYTGSLPFHTGKSLLEWCREEDSSETLLCMGYLAGVSDALEGIAFNAGWGTSGVCRPKGTTVGRVRDAVIRWADAHPAQMRRAASVVVINALQAEFPCEGS